MSTTWAGPNVCPRCGQPEFPAERGWFVANGFTLAAKAAAGDASAAEVQKLGDELAALREAKGTLCGLRGATEVKARMAELIRPMMGAPPCMADALVAEYLVAKEAIRALEKLPVDLTPRELAGMFLKVGGTGAVGVLQEHPGAKRYQEQGVEGLLRKALGTQDPRLH